MPLSSEKTKRPKQRPAKVSADGLRKLPEGWLRWWDETSSQFYYQNTKTGQVSWSDPTRWKLGQWLDHYYGNKSGKSRIGQRSRRILQKKNIDDDDSVSSGSSAGRGPESIEQAFSEFCLSQHYDGDDDDEEEEEEDDDLKNPQKQEKYQVWLHVYDVKFRGAGMLNSIFRPLTLGGAFHTGIEVYGREWSFGATAHECGIFAYPPKTCEPHRYRESISLGFTSKSELAVFESLLRLAPLWWGTSYDLLRKNCNSFCIVFAGALGVQSLPEWVHSLADGAAAVDDRTRRVFAALTASPTPEQRRNIARREARQRASDLSIHEAAVVADDYGRWRVDRYATYAAAKECFDDLPLRHASALFVKPSPTSPWRIRHTYGIPSAVANIQRRFLPQGRLDLFDDNHQGKDDSSLVHAEPEMSPILISPIKDTLLSNTDIDADSDSDSDLEEHKIEPRRAHSERRPNQGIFVTSRLPPPRDNLGELASSSGSRKTFSSSPSISSTISTNDNRTPVTFLRPPNRVQPSPSSLLNNANNNKPTAAVIVDKENSNNNST
mmetsp:Transcript_18050/g.27208  ORF Transcript_18050/g.27208 Transcript_18050/m.27208 type:complete len:550 (-) Transcript_18050:1486-3135(-)